MHSAPAMPASGCSAEQLDAITALYDQGLYLQAFRQAETIGPLKQWTGTRSRILAGRLAANLGGQRFGEALILDAWRHDRQDPEASWFRARHLLDFRGPWPALRFMKSRGTLDEANREMRSYWLSLHAKVLGQCRDFDRAAKWLAQAEAVGGDLPWIHVERAALCAQEDREEDAIRAARRALEVRPWYRPAVQWLAHFLVQKEQDDEALQLLSEAGRRLESFAVLFQLANLQLETGRHAEARESLEQCVPLAPLMDKPTKALLAGRRCDAAYHCSDLEAARGFARDAHSRFYDVQVERLQDPAAGRKRVCIPVGFVRQHHVTCAPATLAAIARFWSMPGEHLEVAAAITYAGTANHSERQWAIDNGWYTKEFTVAWDSARAVLDRGIPFTLTTLEISSAHLQAVIGYDELRGALILRDPGERHQREMLAEGLERYRSSGPRGMALVPRAKMECLESLSLPDEELHDCAFQLHKALESHDRPRAEAICHDLNARFGGHRITLLAERTLAFYDADGVRLLAATEKLSRLFPDDLRWQLAKVASLRNLARRGEFLELLEGLCSQPQTDPACWEQLAQELAGDARQHPRAERLLKRVMRVNPGLARAFVCLARIYWAQQRFEEALELYRLATCLEDTDEYLAQSYFEAAIGLGRVDEALDLLKSRFQRFGKKSAQPARSLAKAYFRLARTGDGYAVLEEAMRLRPDDGDLLLTVLDQYVQHGNFEQARGMAVRARNKSHRIAWLRSTAELESAQGNLKMARKLWGRVLAMQPLAEDAHGAYARLLAETVSRDAALDHLFAICSRFPHNFPLMQLLLAWRCEDGPVAVEEIVRTLIDLHPDDAWSRRELALTLAQQNRLEEAFAALDAAEPLEPRCLSYYTVRAALLEQTGQVESAKESYRDALHISADATSAMNHLLNLCATPAERREELEFIEQEMIRQVILGDALLTYRDLAAPTLERDELLVSLQKALDARPDLWQAWAAVIRQLRDMQELDHALDMAHAALQRFPLVPELWVDLAQVRQARNEEDAAEDALKSALCISPGWSYPLQMLSELYRYRGDVEQARTLVEGAVARAPLPAVNHFILARLLWNTGDRHQAFERMRRTLNLDPDYENAWDCLCNWATNLDCFQAVVDIARGLTVKRPGEIRSWMCLAQALRLMPGKALRDDPVRQAECLQALDRVLELRPWLVEAYDQKAILLTEADRWQEAQAACQAAVWQGHPPAPLRGRLAWIAHQRGKPKEAIAQMEQVVGEDPAYYWGWGRLAEWHEEVGQHAERLRAREMLLELDPHRADSYAGRAEARRALNDRAGAIADYQRAVDLAPDYVHAALQLVDLHLDDGNTAAAREILDGVDPAELRFDFQLRSLLLAKAENDSEAALAALEDLCGSNDSGLLKQAVKALEEAGLAAEAEDVLRRFLGSGGAVCRQWIDLASRRSSLEAVADKINALVPKHFARTNVLVAYADALADAGKSELLHAWVQANEPALRAKTYAWSAIGSHYGRVLDDRRTVAWMSDWQERADVQPWMLINLALALRGMERFADAAVVNAFVLEKLDSDYTSPYHRMWLNLDDALAGNTAPVEEYFRFHEPSELDPNHRWIAALARAVLESVAVADKAQALAEAERQMTDTAAELEPIDRDAAFEIAHRKSIEKIAANCGVAGSAWERTHLETPVLPKRKPLPGAQEATGIETANLVQSFSPADQRA